MGWYDGRHADPLICPRPDQDECECQHCVRQPGYRVDLIAEAGAERQRAEKLLEDAQIKLSVVVSDLFGTSGRLMMAALIAGQRDPHTLAELARASLRRKIPALQESLTGHFNDHHAFLLGKMIARVEAVEADIREVDARIEAQLAPFASAAARLLEIPGIGPAAAVRARGQGVRRPA